MTHEEYVERTLLRDSPRYIPVPEPYRDGDLLVKGVFVGARILRGFGTWTDGVSRHSRVIDTSLAPAWLLEEARRVWLGARTAPVALAPGAMSRRFEEAREDSGGGSIPAPLAPASPARLDELPPGALRMAKKAHAGGWEVRAAKSEGWEGRHPPRVVQAVQVAAMSPDGETVSSIWTSPDGSDAWKRTSNRAGYGGRSRKVTAREVDSALG